MIPKIIHYCWLSEEEYPDIVNECMESWKDKLSDYEFIKWDLSKFNINDNKYFVDAYNKQLYAFIADYIRLYAVYHYGGIYLDSDVKVLKPFDDYLLDREYMIAHQSSIALNATVFGAEKNNEIIKTALSYYDENIINKELNINNLELMELTFGKSLLNVKKDLLPMECFSSFYKGNGELVIYDNTYTIHYSTKNWIRGLEKYNKN